MISSNRRVRRLSALLGGVLAVTAVSLIVLVFRRPATLVEMTVKVDRAVFTVLPILPESTGRSVSWTSAPPPLTSIPLLAPDFAVLSLEVREFDLLKASLDRRPVSLRPGENGSVTLRALNPDELLQPELTVHGPTRLILETSGQDRSSSKRLVLKLEPQEAGRPVAPAGSPAVAEAEPGKSALKGWQAVLSAQSDMIFLPSQIKAVDPAAGTLRALEEREYALSPMTPDLVFSGGSRFQSWLGLTFEPSGAAATLLGILDPETGEVTEKRLPPGLPEVPALLWRDRILFLRPIKGEEAPRLLLKPGLRIQDLEFFRRLKLEAESFVQEGQIRFPAGEKEPVDLTPDTFLQVESKVPFSLRSLSLTSGSLELVLWGEATSLRMGPTPALNTELLPSLLEWIYTHRLWTFVYSTLVWIFGVSLAGAKLFGLHRKENGG